MFPLGDDNPTLQLPYVTFAIIAANVAAWVFLQGFGVDPTLAQSVCSLGAIPGELLGIIPAGTRVPIGPESACIISGQPNWTTTVSSMFMHGGWMHIIGNMWFLFVFGDNVEDSMGPLRFSLFYVLCGLAAVAAQVFSNPASSVPMVGASGAIGGVMGAYAVLYPKARVQTLLVLGFFVSRIAVPAIFMLGYWFVIQVVSSLPAADGEGGVAFWAHIGGFLAGVALIYLFRDPVRVAAHKAASSRPGYGSARHRRPFLRR